MTSNAAKAEQPERLSKEAYFDTFSDLKANVKEKYPIDAAFRDLTGAQLRQRGATFECCCPFHQEKTPSMRLNAARGTYRCFGAGCGASGDVIDLISQTQNITFREAVVFGADRIGLPVHEAIRHSVERSPASTDAAPRIIKYPEQKIAPPPAVMKKPEFVTVPYNTRKPGARKWFRMWSEGGGRSGREPGEKNYKPAMVHDYKDIDGRLLMCVLRIPVRDKKVFIPARLAEPVNPCPDYLLEPKVTGPNGQPVAWVISSVAYDEARPVYGMEDARAWLKKGGKLKILQVEGEKTRDAAKRLLSGVSGEDNWLVLSPMGGSGAASYADWEPLVSLLREQDFEFYQWPDADKVLKRPDGTEVDRIKISLQKGLSAFYQKAVDLGVGPNVSLFAVDPPLAGDVKSGWDAADAEEEGWDYCQTVDFITRRSRPVRDDELILRPGEDIMASANEDVKKNSSNNQDRDLEDYDVERSGGSHTDLDTDWADLYTEIDAIEDETEVKDRAPELPDPDDQPDGLDDFEGLIEEHAGETEQDDGGGEGDDFDDDPHGMPYNRHFRFLGFLNNADYFMSLDSGQIFQFTATNLKPAQLLHLAPRSFWVTNFPSVNRNGDRSVNWELAIDYLVSGTYEAGPWEPQLQCSQGARLDGDTVVFNTGSKLYIKGRNIVSFSDFDGKYCYCVGPRAETPDITDPFEADSADVRAYLEIIRHLDWREEGRELSIMALFGWTAIAPICGVLDWRPHLWLDGPFGSGKSWVVNHLVKPVLGDYSINIASNAASESGIRNMLNGRSVPVIFDEAEGENKNSRARMDAIISLARHSAHQSDAVVPHGVPGGGSHRYYSIASMFLMTSIVPQLEEAADRSRFARLLLGGGRDYKAFAKDIEEPAHTLLTKSFSLRWIGRMIHRAPDYKATYIRMVHALSSFGLSRRIADVMGAFASGCWLMLRDGVPENEEDAALFLSETFDVVSQMIEFDHEITGSKDHHKLVRAIMSHRVMLDGQNNHGSRAAQFGTLLEIACGFGGDEHDMLMSVKDARKTVLQYGFRPGIGSRACDDDETATHVLIHKNATPINEMLEKTPYARSYPDVIHQDNSVKKGKPIRFGAALGVDRPLVVPVGLFSIGEELHE